METPSETSVTGKVKLSPLPTQKLEPKPKSTALTQTLKLNIIPFTAPVQEKEFFFYTKWQEGYCPIHKEDLKGVIEELIDEDELENGNWLYTDFKAAKPGAIPITVDLTRSTRFAQHYYRELIRAYFKNVADVWRNNFTNEIEVWFHNPAIRDPKYKTYNQFTLKVQHCRVTNGPELVLSYDGTTKVYSRSIAQMSNFNTNLFNWINCDGELHRWKYLPEHYKQSLDKLFPVLSNTLKPQLDVAFDVPDFRNRYPKYYNALLDFYNKYLNTNAFRSILPITKTGFLPADTTLVQRINSTSNELLFGKGVGKEPKTDFKRLGPYKAVPPPNNVKFFFIYQKSDRQTAVKAIYDYFLKGFKGEYNFPNMQSFIRQPFQIEEHGSIAFDTLENAVSTVQKAISVKEKLPDTRYCAIFINPVPKADKDPWRNSIYYQIKEILLNARITSQVIKSEHIFSKGKPNKDFNLFLPHMEVAILAKLDGIPWRLNRPSTNELIVGIGAFYSITRKTKYIGAASCFNNEGGFKGFDCFGANDTDMLAGSIREAVGKFMASNYKASRLIIHFYKDISKKELEPIKQTLHALGLPIPVIVVSINKTESKELLAFDTSHPELMPYSGIFVKVGWNEYLLFNNTRYEPTSKPARKEYHFPVKISLACSVEGMLDDNTLVEQLIDQVYQFSRMYWKSTGQQNLPVTIKYPEMVAQIFPYFKYDKLPEFGKENLWFL